MMSISLDQILSDARLVANRLSERGKLGVSLHFEVDKLNKRLEMMKLVQDDTESLNKLARGGKTNSQMLSVINNENPNYREIVAENRELKACLEDYRKTIELIMTKYRQHTQERILSSQIVMPEIYNEQKDEIIRMQEIKIREMAAVMKQAATMDEENINKETEKLVQLIRENEGLRELLQISRRYGSLNSTCESEEDTRIENPGLNYLSAVEEQPPLPHAQSLQPEFAE